MQQQKAYMLQKSQDWGDKISAGHMDRTNVALALNTTIWKTLSYPLPTTLLTKLECDEIMRPALLAALPKMSGGTRAERIPRT